jgi:transposase
MERFKEIKILLESGRSIREISRSLNCTRRTIRLIKNGKREAVAIKVRVPLWTEKVDWETVLEEVKAGHYLKHIWEERVVDLINYSGFWKQFKKLYPEYQERIVTNRFFNAGEYCEVDYAGDTIAYVLKTGEIKRAPVFIGALCYSQLLFAHATQNTKGKFFLESHAEMYKYFRGVPLVTVPDCLKQGVKKSHIFDPDINEVYSDFAKHYGTSIVPARVKRPKDKAIVEGAVKIIMRYFKYIYRNETFRSVTEINTALRECINRINNKPHTRLKLSRNQMWLENEKSKLKLLPTNDYEFYEWKECKVHPDSHITISENAYSVPYIYRGKRVKVKVGKHTVEIYFNLERIALHSRAFTVGSYVSKIEHLPKNTQAYYENTPQNILSQAKFINRDLNILLDAEFKLDTLGNLRKAQGFISIAKKEVVAVGHEQASINISKACLDVQRFNKFRVYYFKEQLYRYRKESAPKKDTEIVRNNINTLLRYNQINFVEQIIKS